MDVLGRHLFDSATITELVQHFRSLDAVATGWSCDWLAGEFSGGSLPVHLAVRFATTGADVGSVLRSESSARYGIWPAPIAFDLGSDVLTWNSNYVQPSSELQHRNTIRHGRCARQSLESPGGDNHAGCSRSRLDWRGVEFRNSQTIPETGCGITCDVDGFSDLEACHFDDVGGR